MNTVNPLLSPPAGLIYFKRFEGVLIETGGDLFERGSLFNLAKTTKPVLHKELEYKVEKLKYKKMEVI